MLDLSAAFDNVGYHILLRRLKTSYDLDGPVLDWFASYLDGRTHLVRCESKRSAPGPVLCGVTQGSVLGPILFLLYKADLLTLIEGNGLHPHLYADDTQIYGFCRPRDTTRLQNRLSSCDNRVASWMWANRLQLNTDNTWLPRSVLSCQLRYIA